MADKQALIVGINNYLAASALSYAEHDARELASALQMPEFNFDTELLIDSDASTENLQLALTSLLHGEAAVKLFYFAGHGYASNEQVYLVAANESEGSPGISLYWLREQILAAKKTVIVILDCCHSGAASVRGLSTYRWLSEADLDRSIGALGTGKILLAACLDQETAKETREAAHGVFTFHLLEGLLGNASNLQGLITPFGLFDYIAGRFAEDGIQTPVFKGDQAGLIILGAGFPPPVPFSLPPLTPSDTHTDTDLVSQLEAQANQLLSDYVAETVVPYDRWKTEGYRRSAQLLVPILRWFRRTVSENPEVQSSKVFSEAYSEANARLAQAGTLSEGTHTEEGRVEKRLGSGAFGTVWKIKTPDQRDLAYKVYHSAELVLKDKIARFERGFRAMELLEHPHIVKVHKYTQCPLGFYMDFVDGPNLRELTGTVSEPAEILQILVKVAETLQHAHGRKVIHRDVKPENIVLTYESESNTWVPHLTDFDLAWFSAATQLTRDAFGAIFYAAPEQLTKPSSHMAHEPTTDVYSFGQLCFFLATGSDPVPFEAADNEVALRTRIGHWRVEQAAEIFAGLYEQCTRKLPADRPRDFREISDQLFQAYSLIRNSESNPHVDEQRFLRELRYALAGLHGEQDIGPEAFSSLSGRTLIEVTNIEEKCGGIGLTIRLEQGDLSVTGATSESARRTLNGKLDRAMAAYPNVTRRSGTKGSYEVFLDINSLQANLNGVDQSRSILARAIDSIE